MQFILKFRKLQNGLRGRKETSKGSNKTNIFYQHLIKEKELQLRLLRQAYECNLDRLAQMEAKAASNSESTDPKTKQQLISCELETLHQENAKLVSENFKMRSELDEIESRYDELVSERVNYTDLFAQLCAQNKATTKKWSPSKPVALTRPPRRTKTTISAANKSKGSAALTKVVDQLKKRLLAMDKQMQAVKLKYENCCKVRFLTILIPNLIVKCFSSCWLYTFICKVYLNVNKDIS
jgi:hypothetical protein